MTTREVVTVDFETQAIDGPLPPKPVGVSVKFGEADSLYLHWGHPDGGNIDESGAKTILADVFRNHPVLCHNAAFDLGVAKYHWGLDYPSVVHDTMFLLFLENPHNENLSLKPNAARLGFGPPWEQDELHEWIVANIKKATKSTAGAYIAQAPASIVTPYACGDTDKTYDVWKLLHPSTQQQPYQRELQLLPIMIDSTLQGVRVARDRLGEDVDYYRYVLEFEVDGAIYSYLGSDSFNIDSGEELANAIDRSGVEVEWVRTAKGARSLSKENLPKAIKDQRLLSLLRYRGVLTTCLDTFMEPWLANSDSGYIHFTWNQVRNREAKDSKGARTGRLSSSPSLLNVPRKHGKNKDLWESLQLPALPNVRNYLLPDEGQKWLKRDYSSQELRVLGHYEDGNLLKAYQDDPALDLHAYMMKEVSDTMGLSISRDDAKTVAFAILYGAGLAKLAQSLRTDMDMAGRIKKAYLAAVPGIRQVQNDIDRKWKHGLPISTFGGRHYHKEPSKIDPATGRTIDFGYKGLNYLIQGSSADITKQALINYSRIAKNGRFLVAVHDEINISGPPEEMELLNEAMLDIPLDVTLLSDGSVGDSYGTLEACNEV